MYFLEYPTLLLYFLYHYPLSLHPPVSFYHHPPPRTRHDCLAQRNLTTTADSPPFHTLTHTTLFDNSYLCI